MPRKRRKIDDETDSARFSFDLNELSNTFTTRTTLNPINIDQLFGRIVTSHAAPHGRLNFSEQFNSTGDPSTSSSSDPAPASVPSGLSADVEGSVEIDWDNYFASGEADGDSESVGEGEEEGRDDNAREEFASMFDFDDVEERNGNGEGEGSSQQSRDFIHDVEPTKVCSSFRSSIFLPYNGRAALGSPVG